MDQKNKDFDYSNLYKGFQNNGSSARRSAQQPAGEADDTAPRYTAASSRPRDPQQERLLQRELEEQLRALGQSVSDGLRTGFDGKGQQLGDQAAKVGGAVWDVLHYSLGTAADELRKAANDLRGERDAAAKARAARRPAEYHYAFGAPAARTPPKLSDSLIRSARTRFGIGLGQAIPGGIIAFGLLLACAICALSALFYTGTDFTAVAEMNLAAAVMAVTSLPFDWLTWLGFRNVGVSKRLRTYAAAIGERTSISVSALAEAVQKPVKKTRKDLRFLLSKGWLTGWLDAENDILYLSAEEWRAAHDKRASAEPATQQPAAESEGETQVSPDTIRRFVQVLGTEQQMMEDPTASEELTKMQTTSQAIADWVAAHPESAPKARRFITYYIPTTLKLLHTYNELQDQPGENAEAIRRDIGGILHTLNIAFENLYNTLLSDVAMDISTEITALQGMLAQDGLSPQQSSPFGEER